MSHLICLVPVCPVRADASHRSEMVSQLLFGEMCELLEAGDDFIRIRVLYDDYEGWCQASQLQEAAYREPELIQLTAEHTNPVQINGQSIAVPFGSSLSHLQTNDTGAEILYIKYDGALMYPQQNSWNIEELKGIAYKYLGTSYLWGGRSVFGTDCSGFTQVVFKCFNIHLKRDARQQATQGEAIGFLEEAQPGDLAFFDNAEGKINHVGIVLDAGNIIHASGKVRIDTLDSSGIISSSTGKRTHNLRVIKHML